jgi:hypothetical protein
MAGGDYRNRQIGANRIGMGTQTRMSFSVLQVQATCRTGKLCYETMVQAEVAADRQMQRGEVDQGCHVRAYRCVEGDCHRFHIGNLRITFPKDGYNDGPIRCACGALDRAICSAESLPR